MRFNYRVPAEEDIILYFEPRAGGFTALKAKKGATVTPIVEFSPLGSIVLGTDTALLTALGFPVAGGHINLINV